ncbi:MAG: hypothetical protein CHACPFDD_03731 [Phycisphaerae bacterium]|nr:hypothetical protein [Phycisphaerae bacterium]
MTVAYTAFGELVTRDGSGNVTIGSAAPSGFPRYQYAGGWGYESGSADASDTSGMLTLNGAEGTSPIRLMHAGERWYQPDIGRFVMRDPIGWRGGVNLYAYVAGAPTSLTDARGLCWFWDWWTGGDAVPSDRDGSFIVNLTGGVDSWLDNPATVKKVDKVLITVSIVCAGGASALPLAARVGLGLIGGVVNVWR